MKILHVPFCFYPDPVGGTEVYVHTLSQALQQRGHSVVIVAPGEREDHYRWETLSVRRLAVTGLTGDLSELYGEGDAGLAQTFGRLLDQELPDITHLHAFTRGVSVRLMREARRRGIPVVFTYHTPTVSCQRGTLLRWGKEVCDGILRLGTCTRCTLNGLGLPRGVADLTGSLPVALGKALGSIRMSGGVWTALRMRELISIRHATFRLMMAEVNHVVALCEWGRDLLIRNGVPSEKITICRHGLTHVARSTEPKPGASAPGSPMRLVFLGRLLPIKGLHVVIQALRRDPALDVTLDVYGIVQGKAGSQYRDSMRQLAGGDRRIRFHDAVSSKELLGRLQGQDLLVVPSQWLETGPLVVLEAFAAGIPVIGSKLGGILELVEDGVNGMLVEAQSVRGWAHALRQVCTDKALLARLRQGVPVPRRMDEVASDMEALYRRLVSSGGE